jgi:tripartite-type tricarboxylate transporter receptor subunit TctC
LPPAVRDALRMAFDKAMKDPDMIADAARGSIDISPVSGARTAEQFAAFASISPEVAARAKAAIQP